MENGSTKNAFSVILPGQRGSPMQEVMIRTVPNTMEPTLSGVSIHVIFQFVCFQNIIFRQMYDKYESNHFDLNQKNEITIIHFYLQYTHNKSITDVQFNNSYIDNSFGFHFGI